MGSTDSGAGEFSVGSIVWVRRRNGSWWPGKIVGPEELSASHLTSPRSGTPVKLLGREDASVYVSHTLSLSLFVYMTILILLGLYFSWRNLLEIRTQYGFIDAVVWLTLQFI